MSKDIHQFLKDKKAKQELNAVESSNNRYQAIDYVDDSLIGQEGSIEDVLLEVYEALEYLRVYEDESIQSYETIVTKNWEYYNIKVLKVEHVSNLSFNFSL